MGEARETLITYYNKGRVFQISSSSSEMMIRRFLSNLPTGYVTIFVTFISGREYKFAFRVPRADYAVSLIIFLLHGILLDEAFALRVQKAYERLKGKG